MTTATKVDARTGWGPAILLCVTVLLVPVGAPGASVSIPGMAAELRAPASASNWVINAFMLAIAAVMAVAGALADRYGRRRVLAVGLLVSVAGNALIATAPAIAVVVAGRAVCGIGAAAITTAGSALLSNTYSGRQRSTVFAVFGTTIGLGLAFGPMLSGLAIAAVGGWRWLYVLYALVAVPPLVLLRRVLPRESTAAAGRFDVVGALVLTTALTAFMIGVSLGPDLGWLHWFPLTMLALAVAAVLVFTRVERTAAHPLVELNLLRVRQFRAVCLTVTLGAFGFVSLVFTLGVFLSVAHHAGALATGAMLVPLTGPTLLVPLLIGRLAHRIPLRRLLTVSMLVVAVGCGWLALIGPGRPLGATAAPMAVIGAGFGLSLTVLDGAALATVPADRAGMAAGVFNTVRLGTESVAVVVVTAIVGTVTTARVGRSAAADLLAGRPAAGAAGVAGYAAGWQLALGVVALLCLGGAGCIWQLLRPALPAAEPRPVVAAPERPVDQLN